MNKNIMWIIIVAVLVVGGVALIASQQNKQAEEANISQEKDDMDKEDSAMEKEEAMMGKGYVMKNGSMMVEENHEFSAMTADVTLKDGTKVMTNGVVVKSDGTTMTLKEGQSIWEDGSIMDADESMMMKEDGAMEKDEKMMKDDGAMQKSDARYVEYSKAALDKSAGNRRVLYFYANWCPTCKQANEDFTKNSSKIPEDMVVIRVNYNDTDTDQEEKDLAKKYGITYQHTFVQIDGQGKEITKWNGGQTDELLANIK